MEITKENITCIYMINSGKKSGFKLQISIQLKQISCQLIRLKDNKTWVGKSNNSVDEAISMCRNLHGMYNLANEVLKGICNN